MRLAPKFILVSLAIALLPLGGAGVRILRSMDKSLRSATDHLQETLARKAAERIQSQMDAVVDLLTLVRGVIPTSNPGKTLESVMNSSPLLTDLWVYDTKETERAAIHRLRPNGGLLKNDWPKVKKAIEARGVFSDDLSGGKDAPLRLFWVVPLTDSSLKNTGYLAARINLAVLNDILRTLDLGVHGRAFLLDARQRLLASSLPEAQAKGPLRVPSEWIERGGDRSDYAGFDGRHVFGAQARLRGLDWRVIFEQPSDDALRMAERARQQILTTLGAAALLSVLLAGLLSGWVTRPLRRFVQVIRKMKGGEFNSLIDVRSRDEMGDIALALQEAQPELEKRVRDSMLGRMARMIGHDLRTPVEALRNSLTAIISHIQDADETAVRHFKLSFSTLDWVADYVEDMLTVGRERALAVRPCSLNDIVLNVLARFEPRDGVALERRLASPLPAAPLDEKEVKRAVANAVKNALEAVSEKGTVTVSTHANRNEVVVRVQDTGQGFTEEKKRRLFEEYTTKDTGSGLGLMVIKKVMDKHQGRVSIQSEPGRGTVVELAFPLSKAL